LFPTHAPTGPEARQVAEDTFHLKHIRASADPINRPGPYERAKDRAIELVETYATNFAEDFQHRRQVEARFEIPIQDAVVSGSIDLMIQEDSAGNIVDACVVDFKAIEGGENPENNAELEWTALALQVQLYATAARDVLGNAIQAGHVHLLKDNQRVEVPVDSAAIQAALANINWAVAGIIAGDFPMRPHVSKCAECDFRKLCSMSPESFQSAHTPPPIRTPGRPGNTMVGAFELFDPHFSSTNLPAQP
jgi:DNA helicase-2/ATP-dependent DNA helicase PcrA